MEEFQHQNLEMSDGRNRVMSVKDWIITMVIMMIPLVNIVMLFVWGFSDSDNRNRSNWAKAQLLIAAIVIALWIIAAIFFGSMFAIFGKNADF